jgi:MFS family permease
MTSEQGRHSSLSGTSGGGVITPEMDRLNGWIFFISFVLAYLAAPVLYVDVVQAALCHKLGASTTLANLPASAYLFGSFAPLILSWKIPYRLERYTVVVANWVTAILLVGVFAALYLPLNDRTRIAAVIFQGLMQGISTAVSQVYTFQCLGRGMTVEGRARCMKLTFTFAPIAAVTGSIGAQFVLTHGVRSLNYPYDFALLYLIGAVCSIGIALASTRYQLVPVLEETRSDFVRYMTVSIKSFMRVRPLLLLWLAYVFWYATISGISNFSLYTHQALGREPQELSGIILALRFSFKAVGGYFLGVMALRWGDRSPVLGVVGLVGTASLWAWLVPGYAYLFAFGLMGAGELGGAYFPNYLVTLSTPQDGARNQSLIALAAPIASVAPTLHGMLTEKFGFSASFIFGAITAIIALALVLKIPTSTTERKFD